MRERDLEDGEIVVYANAFLYQDFHFFANRFTKENIEGLESKVIEELLRRRPKTVTPTIAIEYIGMVTSFIEDWAGFEEGVLKFHPTVLSGEFACLGATQKSKDKVMREYNKRKEVMNIHKKFIYERIHEIKRRKILGIE